ncbi:MAG: hypothetical protein IJU94_05270 [Clostridia bacterium]|nr:hypothetical protein [Clostridia bacterium]
MRKGEESPSVGSGKEASFVRQGKRGFSLSAKGLKNSHFYAILIKEKEIDKTGFGEMIIGA